MLSATGHSESGVLGLRSGVTVLGDRLELPFIGGTSLLTVTYRPEERAKAQAANDMLIFTVGLISAFGSGALLEALGWEVMNLILLPRIALAAACFVQLHRNLRLATLLGHDIS